jgi:pimeloyl-ACP methyl ester carboxylesterase
VTGHTSGGNSAALRGSWAGDGALKPSPYQGDIIASRLAAPTLHNLAHHRTGAGEPLVLLHGVGESAVGWQPIRQALSDRYDVITFDLPGFGRSPALPPGVMPTAAALADAIEGELDRRGVAQFHVAGYSVGARAPGYLETVQASMFDVPTRLEQIACPVLLLQGTADPLVSMQSPRFLALVRRAQLQWLPGLIHVPIADDPQLVASLMLRFLKTATENRERDRRLPAKQRSRVS